VCIALFYLCVFQEALTLKSATLPRVKVTATVVFSILNSHIRRAQRDTRVIGTLLGEVKDGVVYVRLLLLFTFRIF
jgi:hypothetical protein